MIGLCIMCKNDSHELCLGKMDVHKDQGSKCTCEECNNEKR